MAAESEQQAGDSVAEEVSLLRKEVGALRDENAKLRQALEQRLARIERAAQLDDNSEDSHHNPLADVTDGEQGDAPPAGVVGKAAVMMRETFEEMRARPANLHQATALLCLDPAVEHVTKVQYLATSLLLVLAQLLTVRGISGGAKYPSCATSDDCDPGFVCNTLASGGNGDCLACLSGRPTPDNQASGRACTRETPEYCPLKPGTQLGTNNGCTLGFECTAFDVNNARLSCSLANHTEYKNGLGGELCSHCFDPVLDGDHWNLGKVDVWAMDDAINRMRPSDMTGLVLVAVLIGMACAAEIRDIKLCELEIKQHVSEGTPSWMRCALYVLSSIRQFALMPMLTTCIPYVIFYRGSDSLSLCFNA